MNSKQLILSLNGLWNKLRNRPLVWDTITTTGWSTLGKTVGFFIPFFIAAWFGVSSETDAFFFAYGLIIFISGIFAAAVESVIVPYIAEARTKHEDVGKFVERLLGISSIGLLILVGIVLLFIKPFLFIITRFDLQSLNLVYHLIIETAPLIILLTWNGILAGTLNAYKKFAFPAVSPVFRTIVNLAFIFTFKDIFGVHAIAWGYVIGEIFRLIFLLSFIYKSKLFHLHFSIKLDSKLKEFFKIGSYQIIAMLSIGLNPIVDKTMASWLGKGSISILYYANILYMVPVTFMSTGIMITLLSHWSERFYQSDKRQLRKDVKKAVKIISLSALLITIGLIFIHQPIVKLMFGRGAFGQERLFEVEWVWVCYLLGFVPHMVGMIFVRTHLVLKNTNVIMRYGFYLFFLNISLNYILMGPFKVAGIALATTFSSIFSLFYLSNVFFTRGSRKKDLKA